jgi:hypothetical protein
MAVGAKQLLGRAFGFLNNFFLLGWSERERQWPLAVLQLHDTHYLHSGGLRSRQKRRMVIQRPNLVSYRHILRMLWPRQTAAT